MRAIRCRYGVIPRAFANHRTPEGYAYRTYLTGILERLGPLPAIAGPTLREVGRLAVELNATGRELEAARKRNRRKDIARLRRAMTPMRTQLVKLEQRLEELASDRPKRPLQEYLEQEA